MKIAITGASGLVGTALSTALRADGHDILRLVRRPPDGPDEARWEPRTRSIERRRLEGLDAVVHLAGAGLASRPWWVPGYPETIRASRIDGTATLAEALAGLDRPPRVLLTASAVGYYGDTGDRSTDESAGSGTGFLAQLCREWEAAARPAAHAGIRVVTLRSGIVLDRTGGLLAPLWRLFRLGLGGRLGSGRQYMSWISLRDHIAAQRFVLTTDTVSGPVNLTAPAPVTNAAFTAALGRAVHRPTPFAVPAAALRLAVGGFADEGVLVSQRVVPTRLTATGFRFTHPEIDAALERPAPAR